MSGQTVPVELWRGGQKIADAAAAFNEDEQTRQVVVSGDARTSRASNSTRCA